MKAAGFSWERATDSAEAVRVLDEATGFAKAIAGGQSLGPMLNLRLTQPELLVDISRCEDLRGFSEDDDSVVLGAAVTHAEIEDGRVPDPTPGWLRSAARRIAYRAVRNRGTIGGSVAHADPAADWPVVLLALGAQVICRGPGGLFAGYLSEFLAGPFNTQLEPAEIVVGVRVPRFSENARFGYHKLGVKTGEFAHAMSTVLRDPESGVSRLVVGAIEQPPLVIEDESAGLSSRADAERLIAQRLPGLSPAALRLHGVSLWRAYQQTTG